MATRLFGALAFSGALLLLGSANAAAIDVGGVKLDDHVTVAGRDLQLNGAAVRTKLVFKVYVASLYLPVKAADLPGVLSQTPRRIQLNLLRTLSSEQLTEALSDGLAENHTAAELAAIKPGADQLTAIMKSFGEAKDKDIITLDFVDDTTRVGLNGNVSGNIPGGLFNQALTRIWLGEKPVQPSVKKALLGG